jgi:tetratricopeptide (TPR) repeat protein
MDLFTQLTTFLLLIPANLATFMGMYGVADIATQIAPSTYETETNLGKIDYRQDSFDKAMAHYQKALTQEPGNDDKAGIYYDIGNTYFKKGELASNDFSYTETVDNWLKALSSYESGLALTPNDIEMQENYDFVKSLLKELNAEPTPNENDPNSEELEQRAKELQEKEAEQNKDDSINFKKSAEQYW